MAETLDTCGCWTGERELVPVDLENEPGRSALAYRVGTHASFRRTMQAKLRRTILAGLTTRADDDPTIGLLDAWATTLDVLTFYQERIANEGFLRTATETRSIRELARAIGYELGPGAAAETVLVFDLETAPGAPESVLLGPGVNVQSIPGPGELPQTFETVEEVEARPEWNAIEARLTRPAIPAFGATQVFLEGVATNLQPGDLVLFVGDERRERVDSERWDVRRVATVEADQQRSVTRVTWLEPLGWQLRGFVIEPAQRNLELYVLRTRTALFGATAPDIRTLPKDIQKAYGAEGAAEWPNMSIAGISGTTATDTIYLDGVYPQITLDSWVVVADGSQVELYGVVEAVESSRRDFTLTAKTTRLRLEGEKLRELFNTSVRQAAVHGESEQLRIAEGPIPDPVAGATIELARPVRTLAPGRPVLVSGRPVGAPEGQTSSELARVATPPAGATTQSTLALEAPLASRYVRDTVRIAANTARATHGESKREVLGSGDGSVPFQRFVLKDEPLTYVPSPDSPTGAVATLTVRVADVRWKEVRSLYGRTPRERVYAVRLGDDGKAVIEFGDGASGARLPTGIENVTADYRVGSGLAGLAAAGKLSLLSSPPLGVKAVRNPFAATGAEDPETLDRARVSAPLTVLTFDRIVSLQDFEDFAAAFAGVGKAQAVWLWNGEERVVHLTVGGANAKPVARDSVTYRNLTRAVQGAGEPRRRVQIDPYEPRLFRVGARLFLDPDHDPRRVVDAAAAALRDVFSFERRAFAQPVAASEVESTIQHVAGVVAVDLTALHLVGRIGVESLLLALSARPESGSIRPAQLLTIDPDGIALTR